MKKLVLIFTVLICLLSNSVFAKDKVKPEFQKYFDEFNIIGTFVLYDLKKKEYTRYNPERAKQQFTPASTYKILNSLIGLETGKIPDENYVFKWNGEDHAIKNWNQDLVFRDAFRFSCVPCYQDLARRIGKKDMNKWVKKVGYGNEDISSEIDMFWLGKSLKISPNQQIKLLRKLYKNQLPFAKKNQELVKKIMVMEDTSKYKLYGKTGWQIDDFNNLKNSESLGWFVGFLEQNDNVYFFATNVETKSTLDTFAESRVKITKNILNELDLL